MWFASHNNQLKYFQRKPAFGHLCPDRMAGNLLILADYYSPKHKHLAFGVNFCHYTRQMSLVYHVFEG